MIAMRMSGGRIQKARAGGYAGGGPAIGYKVKRVTKILQLDEDKAHTVKRVSELRKEKSEWTLKQIANQLNEEGHKTARGVSFSKVQVKRILDRQYLYSGQYRYADIEVEGLHEAII